MISRTKFKIDSTTIENLLCAAGIAGAREISPLGAGEYNAVFSATAHGKEYAIKIAPPKDVPILTYEKGMMRAEVFWYRQMREHTSITVPEIYFEDFEHQQIPTDYFIMEKLSGQQLDKMKLSDGERARTDSVTAAMAAQIHKIKNDRFGYVQNGLHDDWYQAIRAMVQALLDDCARKGKKSKRGKKLLTWIDRYRDVLEKAECCMVNFDIWWPNIICSRENGTIKYAWIDPERSFWGDRIADFVCLEWTKPLEQKKKSLAAYNAAADLPIHVTREEKIRYAVAQGYLALIQEVEKYYRYTPAHFGWWRNILSSAWFYRSAFRILEHP